MKSLIILLRFNKVGNLYNPNSTEKIKTYLLPLGLAYIAAVLKKSGEDVTVLNLNNREGLISDIIKEDMTSIHYDVVFLGGLSLFYPHLRDIIQNIRDVSPTTKIIVGGGIITAQPEIMFNLLKPDFGIIGEGESTVLELMNCFKVNGDFNLINGLIFLNSGVITITPPREAIMNLDDLPFPDYEAFGYTEYLNDIKPTDYIAYDIVDNPRYYPVLASRSCPFNCTFCFHPLGKKYRQRSVDNIMEEIKQNVEKHHINIIFTYDELFSHDKDRMIDFCKKFKSYSDTLPYKLWFYCNNRVDSTTDEMLKIMRESGAYLLSFGLESYSKLILDSMKKHTTPEQINKIVHLMRDNKLGLQGSFIFGDVNETCETAKETLNFLKNNRQLIGTGVSSVFIVPFQGTPIYKQCIKEGKIKDELQFIKNRELTGYDHLKPMNLTSLSDKQFLKLKNAVLGGLLVSDCYASPIKEWIDEDNHVVIDIKCPSCKQISTIKNVPTPAGYTHQNIGCRHCFFRFDLVSKWYLLWKIWFSLIGFNKRMWLSKIKNEDLSQLKKRLLSFIGG
jgi:anaerobic magnesium-protoporphyrin IX monomethyl ester cyclase